MESRHATSVGNYGKPPRTIPRNTTCKTALPDASESLADRLRGMLCSFSLCAIYRYPIRGSNAIFHRCEQSLQWVADDRHEAFWKWLHGTTELHLEPLHGHRLKRRIPAVLGRSNFVPSPRTPSSGLRAL